MACPDAGTLAAYLDGQLFAEERERVEEHLSHCATCCSVAAAAVRFETERLGHPRMASPFRLRFAAGFAAMLLAAALVDAPRPRARQDLRTPLLAATQEARPLLPRLTGGFAWAPLEAPLRSLDTGAMPGTEPGRWRYFAAAEQVRKRAEAVGDAEGLGAMGAANLLVGNVDEAVTILRRAVAAEPGNAGLHSDLAAALIARGMAREGTDDLARAIESAGAALALAADLPEARFNRALALELLPLPGLARQEWQRFVAADSSPWAAEARGRLRGLGARKPPPAGDLQARLEAAALASGSSELPELVRRFRHQARRAVQESLLPAWGAHALAGDAESARRHLRAAEAIAREWARQVPDDGLARAVAEIAAANGDAGRRLARGWMRFGEASAALEERRFREGHEAALVAARDLAGGPAGSWAETIELLAAYYLGLDGSLERLQTLHPTDLSGRARALWIRGLAAMNTGHLRSGIPLYVTALESYEALGEAEPLAWLHLMLAEVYSGTGDRREAWSHLRQALAEAPALVDRPRAARILLVATDLALAEGNERLAAAFLDELLTGGSLDAVTGDATDAHLRRAHVALAFGERDVAQAQLAAAERSSARIADAVQRRRLTADLDFVRGMASADPREQRAAFSRAEAGYLATGMKHRVPGVLLERGLAMALAGRATEAERDLRRGLALLDEEQEGGGLWLDQMAPVGRVFDGMVALALGRGDTAEAFAWAEAGRASALRRALGLDGDAEDRELGVAAVQAEIDPRTALLLYTVLPDRAVVFQVTRDEARVHELGLPPEELRRLGATLVSDIAAGTWTARTRAASASLYRALVAPLAIDPAISTLAIVADDELHEVPFAALVDPDTDRYLLEQHEIVAAPSSAVFLQARSAARERRPGAATALVIGDPRLDPVLFPSLPPLPSAAAEARAVAGLYPGAELFVGSLATRDSVMAALSRHDIVHFAGHATVNRVDPRLSGLPLASIEGRPAWLHAEDVTRLALGNTRVVVLSACDTAQGPLRPGEGPMSLARAFLAARVPSVVATLWPVSDGDTGPLLAELHRRLRRGDDAAAALRGAQLSLIRSPHGELRIPTRWAAYQALGG